MPIKRVTPKEFKALGIPIHRSYIHVNEKPIPYKKFKKWYMYDWYKWKMSYMHEKYNGM